MTMAKGFNKGMRFGTVFAAFIALAVAAHAQPLPKDLVKASLVADVKTVKAGEPFQVGVLLKMKPHWHV